MTTEPTKVLLVDDHPVVREGLRGMIDATGRDIPLEVDGGVTPQTAAQCVAAGATALVAGTAVFKGGAEAYAANIAALRGG